MNARTVVRQPEHSNLCGHACVAIICRTSLEEGICLVKETGGPRGLTGARHLRRALGVHGYRMDEDCSWLPEPSIDDETGRAPLEGLWVCRMRWPKAKKTHWVVVEDGVVLDPAMPDPARFRLTHDELVAVMVRQTSSYLSSGYRVEEDGSRLAARGSR